MLHLFINLTFLWRSSLFIIFSYSVGLSIKSPNFYLSCKTLSSSPFIIQSPGLRPFKMRELKNLRRTCKNKIIFWCFFRCSNRCLEAKHKTGKKKRAAPWRYENKILVKLKANKENGLKYFMKCKLKLPFPSTNRGNAISWINGSLAYVPRKCCVWEHCTI